MADLAKCSGTDCPARDRCRRYLAPSSGDRQAWLVPETTGEDCPDFWPVRLDADSRHAVEVGS